jgi:tRNA 2-thiouridine synthesizing protein A
VSDVEIHGRLTVLAEACPMNYVRTKLRLEEMTDGQVLEVVVSEGEAARNVPRSAAEEGHEVLETAAIGGGAVRILIRKREARRGS